ARYVTTGHWLGTGFRRQKPAAIGALLAAWTGIAFSLWIAVGGIVVGALLGALGPTSLGIGGTLGANTGTGVFFAIVFAILGGIAGLLAIDILLILPPLQLVSAIGSGAILSTAVLFLY